MTNAERVFQESKAVKQYEKLCFHHNHIFLIYDNALTKVFMQ